MSYTDEIYHELMDGLKINLDWQQFLTRHSSSKGPLYSAIGRFFTEVGIKIQGLNEEESRVQSRLDQARLTLESLEEKTKEAERNIVSLKDRENGLNMQVETLETKTAAKGELVGHLVELENAGFNVERMKQLQDVLREMGKRHGLIGKDALNKFFGDLREYDAVLDAESELKRLQTIIDTKALESENWQAKEEALRRKHENLNEAVKATQLLYAKGIKESEIIAWHKVLSRIQTVEQFAKDLAQYGDLIGLLKARKEETKTYELRVAKTQSQLETLEKERAKIEGAIDAIKMTAVKELKEITEETTKQLKVIATTEIRETRAIGQGVREGFSDLFSQLDALGKKTFEIGQEYERTMQKLQKYEGVKEVLQSHLSASEQK